MNESRRPRTCVNRTRAPRFDELETLRELERDAARALASIGMTEIANHEPLPIAELEAFRPDARPCVLVNTDALPVAYLLSGVVDRCAHIDARAAACGREALTLTTFRDVP